VPSATIVNKPFAFPGVSQRTIPAIRNWFSISYTEAELLVPSSHNIEIEIQFHFQNGAARAPPECV
jgi:hypothetical protein